MIKHFLTAAKCATAFGALLLSPIVLGLAAFAAYFVVDGAHALGRTGSSAVLAVILGGTLLLRWRRRAPV